MPDQDSSIDQILCTTKIEYRILLEMKLLMTEFPTGSIYLMPSKSSSLNLDGILFVRSGIYKNGIFRFTVILDQNFPCQKLAPVIKLNSNLIHPLVSPETLIFDSSTAFPSWSENDHIYEIMKFFKYAMENIEYSCSLQKIANPSAVELYNNDKQKFNEIVREAVTKSVNETFTESNNLEQNIFSFDKSTIDEGLHDQILDQMKSLVQSGTSNDFSFSFERRG